MEAGGGKEAFPESRLHEAQEGRTLNYPPKML